jgi:hypothetical protein
MFAISKHTAKGRNAVILSFKVALFDLKVRQTRSGNKQHQCQLGDITCQTQNNKVNTTRATFLTQISAQ